MTKKKKKNSFMSGTGVTISVIIGMILIASIIYFVEKEDVASIEPKVEKIYIDKESNKILENFNKKDAVETMAKLLRELQKDVDGKDRTIEERLVALDNEKTDMEDVLSEKAISMLHLHEEFKDVTFNRQFTSSALLTYTKLIEEASGSKDMEYSDLGLEELVYFDKELKTAHIPIDIFTGDNRGVAFEMNYIDGEWKFTPYTSIMSLVMMVNYEERFRELLEEVDK